MTGLFTPRRLLVGALFLASIASVVAAESGPALPAPPAATAAVNPTAPAAPATAPATPAQVNTTAAQDGPADPAPAAENKSPPPLGDALFKGQIDLDRAVLEKGRYLVDLDHGRRAVLTLDPTIQAAADHALKRAKAPQGAIVVLAPDGRILALAGRRDRGKKRDFDLAMSVWAPAASVFKIVTASALVAGGLSPDQKVCYHGGLRSVDASNLKDSPRRDNRCGDLGYGLAKSQNALIAKLAHRHLDPSKLRHYAHLFGFDSAPEFALDAEACRSDIPDQPLPFARVSAGFWHTELSPLGGALLANTIASRGLSVTPRIVAAVIDANGHEQPIAPVPAHRVVSAEVAGAVTKAMVGTTERGTAYKGFHDRRGRKFLSDVAVAGKTGTLSRNKPSYLQYSWFVGFAPASDPEVTIAVLLGNSELWYLKAHTAARMVLQKAL